MKRRSRKLAGNCLLITLLALLLAAQLGFPPLTVRGMCRRMGDTLLMTPPEPVWVEKRTTTNLYPAEDLVYIVGRSGASWVTFMYSWQRKPWEPWELDYPHQWVMVEEEPFLDACQGKLFCIGAPKGAASAACRVTVRETTCRRKEDRTLTPPEYGREKTFAYDGELLTEQVWAFPVHDYGLASWAEERDEDKQLADLCRDWYQLRFSGPQGELDSMLRENIPVDVDFFDASGRLLETLPLTISNERLTFRW